MAFPTGSLAILCGYGPEYSMMTDDAFDALSADPLVLVQSISKEVFELWFSNVKRATSEQLLHSSVSGPSVTYTTNLIQWITDGTGGLIEINDGDHPVPMMFINAGNGVLQPVDITTIGDQRYFSEPDGLDPLLVAFPWVVIHHGEFYFIYNYIYDPSTQDSVTVTLDADKLEAVYVETIGGPETITSTYRITIDELFYP